MGKTTDSSKSIERSNRPAGSAEGARREECMCRSGATRSALKHRAAWTAVFRSAIRVPAGNLIPDWNDLVYRDRWKAAIERLHATNNFPEWTGRLCPRPARDRVSSASTTRPVTIKAAEAAIIERAFEQGWIVAQPPSRRSGKRVAVVGSGLAGWRLPHSSIAPVIW